VETPTQQVEQVTPEVPFNEHPRFKELIEERNYLRALAARNNAPQPVSIQAEADPYTGMDAETKAFFQQVDKRAEQIAKKIVGEKEMAFKQELDKTHQILATVSYERFQAKHPDVAPDSQEEMAIATLYSKGYSLEDAYKVAMFDKMQNQKVQQAQVKQKQTVQQKVAANVETSTIPASSGLPQTKKKSIREFVEEQFAKGQL
jgi:hypothetical protein